MKERKFCGNPGCDLCRDYFGDDYERVTAEWVMRRHEARMAEKRKRGE